jgi:hypothetical protein
MNQLDQDILFRRTTFIVSDINKSLFLYKNLLGMGKIYDNFYIHNKKAISGM